ncbi:MAG: flavin reductase family protein [Anaerolineae bacterium]|nr:flavin reductase family protein [Anaerolineae bacterium]
MPFDAMLQRRIMGHFATGITVVTTCYQEGTQVWAMTANSFTSLSLDPPLILITIDKRNMMGDCIKRGGCFAVNILGLDQEAVSRRFATRGPKDFEGLDITIAETGAPIIGGTLAYLDCRLYEVLPGGDHDIFIGEVMAGEARDGRPLIFYNGRYSRLALHGTSELTLGAESIEDSYAHYGSF